MSREWGNELNSWRWVSEYVKYVGSSNFVKKFVFECLANL